jgi:hypothetical protein
VHGDLRLGGAQGDTGIAECKEASVMRTLMLIAACRGPSGPPPHEVLAGVIEGRASEAEIGAWEAMLDERAPHAGPQHEEIFRAFSPDGYTIDLLDAQRLREHAAVPEAVRAPDGRVHLYFVEGDLDRARALARNGDPWMRTHGILGFGAIDLAIADTPRGPFRAGTPFVVHGMVHGMVVDPTVRALPGGGWRLYYLGVPVEQLLATDAWADGADHTVYTARSSDLVEWEQEGVAVVGPNADPAVWCDGDWCLMVSTGLDRSVSTDGGRTFAFEGDFGVPGFAPAFVDLPDGSVRLFYNSKDRGGPLRSMRSTDRGRTFTPEPGDRVPGYTLEAPSFLPAEGGGWWVYYHYWVKGMGPDLWEAGYRRKDG